MILDDLYIKDFARPLDLDNYDVVIPTDNFNPTYYANLVDSSTNILVRSTIKDEFGDLLIGAALQNLNDKTKGTTTDFNGKIEFYAQPNDLLEISYLGYKSQQFKASVMPGVVVLKEDAQSLETVWITPTPIQTVQPQPTTQPVIPNTENDKTTLYLGIGIAALAGLFLLAKIQKEPGMGAAKICNNRTKCTGLRKNGILKKGYKYGTGGKVIKVTASSRKKPTAKGLKAPAVLVSI